MCLQAHRCLVSIRVDWFCFMSFNPSITLDNFCWFSSLINSRIPVQFIMLCLHISSYFVINKSDTLWLSSVMLLGTFFFYLIEVFFAIVHQPIIIFNLLFYLWDRKRFEFYLDLSFFSTTFSKHHSSPAAFSFLIISESSSKIWKRYALKDFDNIAQTE